MPLAAALTLLLTGCFTHRHTEAPLVVEAVEQLSFSAPGDAPRPDLWWTAFDDPTLNAAMAEALDQNFDVQAALARVEAARSVTRGAWGALAPEASGFADVARGGGVEVGVQASFELDLWGRISSEARAAGHREQSLAADADAAKITLAAELVSTWIAIAATQELLALANTQIEANLSMADVVRARFLNGVVRQPDTLRQDRLVEQTRIEQIARREDLEVSQHRLAVLMGRAPTAALPPLPEALSPPPPLPETGLPAELLRRRPDLRSAELALYAADADLAVAITEQYPRVTLGAVTSTAPVSPEALLRGWALSLAGQLTAPIFMGGQLRAEVRRSRAVVAERVAQYSAAVLTALQEVEDALSRDRLQAEALASIDRQVDLATRTADGLRLQYIGGLDVGYLDVLTAQTAAQQLLRQQISERQRQLQLRVDLHRALAGGVPPTATEPLNER